MKTIVLFASFLALVCSAVAQDEGPVIGTPVIGTLNQSLQKKTESLNSQYLVFSAKGKSETALPLLIYLHPSSCVQKRRFSSMVSSPYSPASPPR